MCSLLRSVASSELISLTFSLEESILLALKRNPADPGAVIRAFAMAVHNGESKRVLQAPPHRKPTALAPALAQEAAARRPGPLQAAHLGLCFPSAACRSSSAVREASSCFSTCLFSSNSDE